MNFSFTFLFQILILLSDPPPLPMDVILEFCCATQSSPACYLLRLPFSLPPYHIPLLDLLTLCCSLLPSLSLLLGRSRRCIQAGKVIYRALGRCSPRSPSSTLLFLPHKSLVSGSLRHPSTLVVHLPSPQKHTHLGAFSIQSPRLHHESLISAHKAPTVQCDPLFFPHPLPPLSLLVAPSHSSRA